MSLLVGGLGGGNGDPLPALEDHDWIHAAIDLSRLPAAGTRVCYFPRGHHEQWANRLGAPPAADPAKPFFSCTVVAVEVRTAEYAPYACITLSPAADEAQGGAPAPAGDVFRYTIKKLTDSDAREPRLIVPKATVSILPDLHGQPTGNLMVLDCKGESWTLVHTHKGGRATHFLQDKWTEFVRAKSAKATNPFFLLRRVQDDAFFVEVRNSLNTEDAEEDRRLAPPPVLQEEINEAITAAAAVEGGPFQVTYYPHKGTGLFVVPRWKLDQALGVNWMPGMQVRMKKLSLLGISDEAPEPETGVITAVHEPISQWGSLQVVWGQSPTPSPTNAWEVELVAGDDAPLPKRHKVAAPPSQFGGTSAASHVH